LVQEFHSMLTFSRLPAFAFFFGLLGCLSLSSCPAPANDDDSSVQPDDDDDDSVELPSAEIPFGLFPAPGAQGVSVYTVVFADSKFAESLAEAVLLLTDPDGAEVLLDLSEVTFVRLVGDPVSPLSGDTTYQAHAEFPSSGEVFDWEFSTGPAPDSFGAPPTGMVYQWLMDEMTIISPVSEQSQEYFNFAQARFLLSLAEDGETLTATGAATDLWDQLDSPQSLCQPTWTAEDGTWNDPHFRFSDVALETVRDVSQSQIPGDVQVNPIFFNKIEGVLTGAPDASSAMVDGRFRGYIDLRDLLWGDICDTATMMIPGSVCEPCPNEPEVLQCFYVWGIGAKGVARPDLVPLGAITTEEILADENCP